MPAFRFDYLKLHNIDDAPFDRQLRLRLEAANVFTAYGLLRKDVKGLMSGKGMRGKRQSVLNEWVRTIHAIVSTDTPDDMQAKMTVGNMEADKTLPADWQERLAFLEKMQADAGFSVKTRAQQQRDLVLQMKQQHLDMVHADVTSKRPQQPGMISFLLTEKDAPPSFSV